MGIPHQRQQTIQLNTNNQQNTIPQSQAADPHHRSHWEHPQ